MSGDRETVDEHVGELLSGLMDGELTQQQRQRVQAHCDRCSQCAEELSSLKNIRRTLGSAQLSETGTDHWRERMSESGVGAVRGAGWMLLIAGLLVAGAVFLFAFLTDNSISLLYKVLMAAIYGGLGLLFVSVLRQRLIERKTDKYKDVEI